jgi:hypothetical protein
MAVRIANAWHSETSTAIEQQGQRWSADGRTNLEKRVPTPRQEHEPMKKKPYEPPQAKPLSKEEAEKKVKEAKKKTK